MEAEVTYVAKDGRRFSDALQCEEYERTIGVIPNTVADVILELDKRDENEYIFGIVLVRHRNDGSASIYTRFTGCVDDKLESFVNLSDIITEQRYITATFGELKNALRKEDKDDWAQYMIVFSSNLEFERPGIMASHNPLAWKDNASNGK